MKPSGSPAGLMTSLAYDRIEEIFARGLHPYLTDVQKTSRHDRPSDRQDLFLLRHSRMK